MSEPLTIQLKTLTPLWTGGVDQTCDRLHETGLIGSLRWWYEALVRGLGGYACDPTSDDRCGFDSKAYERAKEIGVSRADAIREGLKTVCPVCCLFGCTGWARLFHLQAVQVPTTSLHFCTTLAMNKGWLERIFAGSSEGIGSAQVPYGNLKLEFSTRGQDEPYTRGQFALVLRLAAEYGGVGARLQHGFGQVSLALPSELQIDLPSGIRQLTEKFQELRLSGSDMDTPFNLQNLVGLTCRIAGNALSEFITPKFVAGTKPSSANYLPCVFDLRYKGGGKWGMRQWLKQQEWKESEDPGKLEDLDWLLGPRSQWGPNKRETKIDESRRTGSRIFFGMPYRERAGDGNYTLRIWAFWDCQLKSRLQTPQALRDLCQKYVEHVFGKAAEVQSVTSGREMLSNWGVK